MLLTLSCTEVLPQFPEDFLRTFFLQKMATIESLE
jgi:hypothetical protein